MLNANESPKPGCPKSEQRRARDRAHDDLELIDGLLAKADALQTEVADVAPDVNAHDARARLDDFADLFHDCLGDTLRAARVAAAAALDDATPMARPGRAA